MLWWSWTGYAWLTSVVNPEEGAVRLVMFTAMAAFLVAALCVPEAFDSLGLLFACAYGVVRWSQIALFVLASRDDPRLRQSVIGLAGGTAVGVGLLVAASFFDGTLQGAVWALALLLDMAEPFFFGSEGWKLMPSHFAERHGLIVIIALGESIVAIGVGADATVDAGVVAAAVLGIAVTAALWWLYFDVVALVAERRLSQRRRGPRAKRDRARLLLLSALPDGGRNRAAGAGAEEDPRARGRAAEARPGGRDAGRHRALPAGAHRVPAPQRPLAEPAAPAGARCCCWRWCRPQRSCPSLATLAILAAAAERADRYEAHRFAEARDRVRHPASPEPTPD